MKQQAAADPFGTTELRRVVLDAWAASPARFREDANAEEALAVGGYAGRVLVELASNAADAARELGVPARIRIRIVADELRVANTGAPLTAAGVAGLASLRASAKRETLDSIGHFGVGFTAALSWTDAPRVVSTSGGIRFAAELTRAVIAARRSAGLDREVLLRDGRVPILRLPWPTDAGEDPPPADYPTEVRLPLADAVREEVERVLADPATAEDLFWALPELAEIDLPSRLIRCGLEQSGLTVIEDGAGIRRYRTADRFGDIPAELLIDRPIEERRRARWRIIWALPVDADAGDPDDLSQAVAMLAASTHPTEVRRTIGAPTPTDEPITLPARLIGTFPVDDTRRRLAAGPLTDYLLELAADTYLDLLAGTEPAERWKLIPAGGFPAGPVDGAIRDRILRRVAGTPLLGTALGDLVKPSDACLLPGLGAQGAVLFGEAIPGLLPPQPSAASSMLRGLGVSILSWSQASSALAGIEREPSFWWHVYEAIATVDRPPDPEDLADIPIPLTGGRRTLGGRGCLLPGTALEPELAHRAGRLIATARIVDPAAVHPLLERLGARPADPELLLAEPLLAEAVTDQRAEFEDADPDSDDIQELAELVLDLIAAAGPAGRSGPGGVAEQVFAGGLLLTDDDGRPCPANELFIPGAPLAAVLTAELDQPLIGAEWTDRYSVEVLTAVGVQYSFGIINVADPSANLPDIEEWFDQFGDDVTIPFPALLDLDLVDDEKWPQALGLIATDRTTRACLAGGTAGGTGLTYSGWWISRFARIAGRAPAAWRLSEATDLVGLYDPLPLALDPHFARSIGVQADLADVVAHDPAALLTRLADPQRALSPGRVAVVTAAVVAALRDVDDLDLPPGVRTITGDVVDGADAAVLDQPWLIQVLPVAGLVPGAGDPDLVAGVLDLPLASAVSRLSLTVGPNPASVVESSPADMDGRLAAAADAVGLDLAQIDIVVSADLRVAVDGGDPVQVTWWGSVDADPADRLTGARYWIDGSVQSCGRVVAWAAGNWSARHRAIAAAGNDWPGLAEDSLD